MAKCQYNDFQLLLPGLPAEWNQITHPHAAIIHGIGTDDPANAFNVWLVCSGEEFTAMNVDGTDVVGIKLYTVVHQFLYVIGSGEWVWEDKGSAVVGDMDSATEGDVTYYYFSPTKTEYVWCNEDIKDTNGTVIFTGSEPVLVEEDPEPEVTDTRDKRTFCLGIALALMQKTLPISKKPPTGYLYGHVAKEGETPTHTINGVDYVGAVLPELPESEWPYAYMCRDLESGVDGLHEVILSKQPLIHDFLGVLTGGLETFRHFEIQPPYSGWEENIYTDPYLSGIRIYIFDHSHENVWCNVDILNEDGSVYLEASEPVPVYE